MFVVIMNLSLYVSNRLFFTKKGNNRYTKPILLIGTLAVTLSVTVMLLSIMITKGFKNQITEKIIGFGGDVVITSFVNNKSYESVPIKKNKSLIAELQSNENIVNVSSFATKAGIFNISYALGRQLDNPLLFRSNKIHFGFISVF